MATQLKPRQAEHKEWFDANAATFADTTAVETLFRELSRDAQRRLNHFKLYALANERLVDWRNRDVLEFGAGHGRFAVELGGYRSYVGVDYSSKLVALGRERFARLGLQTRARLEVADCLSYDGPAAAYDVVCSLGILPYLDDLDAVVGKMAYHTRPGGVVFADFKHGSPLYAPLRRAAGLRAQTGGISVTHTKSELERAVGNAGLVDIKFVMREYPFLGKWYAKHGWEWPLRIRQALAHRPIFDLFALTGFVVARKPG